jgi:Mg2+-importing ATPase
MVVFGLTSSVFDFLTFGVLRLAFDARAELFRSGWFFESLATELAVMLVLRTRRRFYESRPGVLLMTTSAVTAVAGLVVVLLGTGTLGFDPVPLDLLAGLVAILAGYICATEIGKAWFYRGTRALSS